MYTNPQYNIIIYKIPVLYTRSPCLKITSFKLISCKKKIVIQPDHDWHWKLTFKTGPNRRPCFRRTRTEMNQRIKFRSGIKPRLFRCLLYWHEPNVRVRFRSWNRIKCDCFLYTIMNLVNGNTIDAVYKTTKFKIRSHIRLKIGPQTYLYTVKKSRL